MLIVARHLGESILINEDTSITVLGIKGKVVRLGIVAPKNISVHREEVYEKMKSVGHHKHETGSD